MFYPVESLKRGGRFYLCWVADSWPLQFATITHRQLCSQDIRTICDDLLEVIINESGRPTQRFSLRLSSQLLRGLVRLYQKKATVYLSELGMLNAKVIKHINQKWTEPEAAAAAAGRRGRAARRGAGAGEPPLLLLDARGLLKGPPKQRNVTELIQNSGNAVANIDDITLKEALIPQIFPPNDGFGEENPEQPFQQLQLQEQDRTLEQMRMADASAAQLQQSVLDVPSDLTAKSRDMPPDISLKLLDLTPSEQHDVTTFNKSTAAELAADFEKDPDISETLNPDLPVPIPEMSQQEVPPPPEPSKQLSVPATAVEPIPVEIELEELEVEVQRKRRRLKNKLIIEKKTQLSSNFMRSRIENSLVEVRCEDSSDDIIPIRVPAEVYLRRPCHGGHGVACNIGSRIMSLFSRNLGIVNVTPLADRVIEALESIPEVQEPIIPEPDQIQPTESERLTAMDLSKKISTEQQVVEEMDIAEIPTQIVKVLSQVPPQSQKRTSEYETHVSPKRPRSGYVLFTESQLAKELSKQPVDLSPQTINLSQQAVDLSRPAKDTSLRAKVTSQQAIDTIRRTKYSRITGAAVDLSADKENISNNIPPPKDDEQVMSSMLHEAGLADIQHQPIEIELVPSQARRESRKTASERSETPLGSLDRTKVSLGDSEHTTDSKRFIRDQWGTEGTMLKILNAIKAGIQPVTLETLLAKGPVLSGHKRLIAARCFNSILKLKQHSFIKICKDPDTLQVTDINLGPRVTSSNEQF